MISIFSAVDTIPSSQQTSIWSMAFCQCQGCQHQTINLKFLWFEKNELF